MRARDVGVENESEGCGSGEEMREGSGGERGMGSGE